MTDDDVQRWLDAYVEAWRSYDREAIGALFSENASYRYHPYDDDAVTGHEGIVEDWLEERDEPGSWEASYRPWVVAGDRAVAVGETRYTDGQVYWNIWQLSFDGEGRCSDYVEWFMTPPGAGGG